MAIVEGRVIVRFRPGADGADVADDHGATHEEDLLLDRAALLAVEPGSEESAAAELNSDPRVEFAEPDFLTVLAPCDVGNCQPINDGFFTARWDLHNTGEIRSGAGQLLAVTGKPDADMDWLEMTDALGTAPHGRAVVGIIDTGIRDTHEDLSGLVIASQNFATGYPSDFVVDRIGHGTHVAGIVAARANNGLGGAGVAYGADIKLINAKACELYLFPGNVVQSSCPSSGVANAITWAVEQGANVLNLSLGSPGTAADGTGSPLQLAALQFARSRNVLPICSVGNENANNVGYPARFGECVAVAATNWSDQRASYSNRGAKVALSAPGGDNDANLPAGSVSWSWILSTYVGTTTATENANNIYALIAGTSMAAPQVSGLAAMLYASGMTSADAVLARMMNTADDLGAPGRDVEFGVGRINAYRALTLKEPGAPPVAHIDPVAPGVEGSPLVFSSAGSGDPNNHSVTYHWDFGDGTTSTEANPTHAYVDDGRYTATLTVTDESNRSTTATADVAISNLAPVVSASLTAPAIRSGEHVGLNGTFTDAGVNDAVWKWEIAWGEAKATGTAESQPATIEAGHRFCGAGDYLVQLSVRDKDGAEGRVQLPLTVSRDAVPIGPVRNFEDLRPGRGNIPIIVYSTAAFDARTIDPSTATLGDGEGAETPVAKKHDGKHLVEIKDENHDRLPDLILYFEPGVFFEPGVVSEPGGGAESMDRSMRSAKEPRPDPPTKIVLRSALADQCTQVEGSWRVTRPPKESHANGPRENEYRRD